uniref:Uncharacterized protein n=1 Tax=Arundo donax TaxID=35708 RepID=A0A0A9DXT8_ARUDO
MEQSLTQKPWTS